MRVDLKFTAPVEGLLVSIKLFYAPSEKASTTFLDSMGEKYFLRDGK
jgi:hypothetical protein